MVWCLDLDWIGLDCLRLAERGGGCEGEGKGEGERGRGEKERGEGEGGLKKRKIWI